MDGCTAFRGQGAAVRSPRKASHARGRASPAFSSRRPSKPLFRRRLRRCEPPPPQNVFFEGDRPFMGRLAQLLFRQAVLPRFAPSAGRPMFGRPHPGTPAARAPRTVPHPSRSACAGSAAVRTALPAQSRATRSSKLFAKGTSNLMHDAAVPPDARRWTRRRPSSGLSSCNRSVPSGQAHRESARFEGEGSIGQRVRRRRFESRM